MKKYLESLNTSGQSIDGMQKNIATMKAAIHLLLTDNTQPIETIADIRLLNKSFAAGEKAFATLIQSHQNDTPEKKRIFEINTARKKYIQLCGTFNEILATQVPSMVELAKETSEQLRHHKGASESSELSMACTQVIDERENFIDNGFQNREDSEMWTKPDFRVVTDTQGFDNPNYFVNSFKTMLSAYETLKNSAFVQNLREELTQSKSEISAIRNAADSTLKSLPEKYHKPFSGTKEIAHSPEAYVDALDQDAATLANLCRTIKLECDSFTFAAAQSKTSLMTDELQDMNRKITSDHTALVTLKTVVGQLQEINALLNQVKHIQRDVHTSEKLNTEESHSANHESMDLRNKILSECRDILSSSDTDVDATVVAELRKQVNHLAEKQQLLVQAMQEMHPDKQFLPSQSLTKHHTLGTGVPVAQPPAYPVTQRPLSR
ncbi:MAG: hypothetical protein V4490_02520 [Pseudomonadota bacterium]